MKYFIVTDIHGSAYWAQRAVDKFAQVQADVMVLLGDVYNHGPRNPFPAEYAPQQVAKILSAAHDKLIVVKGNCDSEVDQMISSFTFVGDDVVFCGGRRFYFTHGHIYNKDNLPHLAAGDALFYGHFHKSEITVQNGVVCVNVGSPSLPKDGKTAYCVASENSIEIFDFDDAPICSHKFNL